MLRICNAIVTNFFNCQVHVMEAYYEIPLHCKLEDSHSSHSRSCLSSAAFHNAFLVRYFFQPHTLSKSHDICHRTESLNKCGDKTQRWQCQVMMQPDQVEKKLQENILKVQKYSSYISSHVTFS